jgi:ferric-dicitrate binding protein FerR (iron transport regulator)
VAVTDGKVAFRAGTSAPGSGVLLVRGDYATIDGRGLMTVMRDVSLDAYRAWARGQLVFKRAKLHDIIRDLERRYDVTIVLRDSVLARATVTATLDTESVDRAMPIIADVVSATWARNGRVITLASKARLR